MSFEGKPKPRVKTERVWMGKRTYEISIEAVCDPTKTLVLGKPLTDLYAELAAAERLYPKQARERMTILELHVLRERKRVIDEHLQGDARIAALRELVAHTRERGEVLGENGLLRLAAHLQSSLNKQQK